MNGHENARLTLRRRQELVNCIAVLENQKAAACFRVQLKVGDDCVRRAVLQERMCLSQTRGLEYHRPLNFEDGSDDVA